MKSTSVALWQPNALQVVPDSVSDPKALVTFALQLREREKRQLAENFLNDNFEVAAGFVWTRAMALLKRQLAKLGSEFIGELLQRHDFDEYTDIPTAITDFDAISLARDLGIVTSLQSLRLFQSQAIITHFAGAVSDPTLQEEEMTREEAISCLRICVQTVLAQEEVTAAEDFKKFRIQLAAETFTAKSDEVTKLQSSPYLFVRTAISVLLSLFRSSKTIELEHASRNAQLIIPLLWSSLKGPERWQIGQAYAMEFNDGRKESVRALHAVLASVKGFDYVPENLRSTTFVKVAAKIMAAHQGANNFYNEAAPVKELANLGTSIPGPALANCIQAVLCVKLGNEYGHTWAAQPYIDQIFAGISTDRWLYYFTEKFEHDRLVLMKLSSDKPLERWIRFIRVLEIDIQKLSSRPVRDLINASRNNRRQTVQTIAERLLRVSLAA